MEGAYPFGEQMFPFFAVNVCTLDSPQEGVELSRTEMKYFDMLHDNVKGGLKETPWEGGLV